ncbi:hypothetical protein [Dyella sp. Tek66A03]|uniref:hypothetical protein n=1 Tax=Dyella sp. Tek66A03 TaxID=3458298 RepID=UPI00403E6F18
MPTHFPASPIAGKVVLTVPVIGQHLRNFANGDRQAGRRAECLRCGSKVQLNDMGCFLQGRTPEGTKPPANLDTGWISAKFSFRKIAL